MTVKRYGTSSAERPDGIFCLYAEYEKVLAECERLRETIKRQANAARAGMDAATRASSIRLELATQARAESSPEVLASERAMNATLTEENEALREALNTPVLTAAYSTYIGRIVGAEGVYHDVAQDVFLNSDQPVAVYYGVKRLFSCMAEFYAAHPKEQS
jgi:hypothetical protein